MSHRIQLDHPLVYLFCILTIWVRDPKPPLLSKVNRGTEFRTTGSVYELCVSYYLTLFLFNHLHYTSITCFSGAFTSSAPGDVTRQAFRVTSGLIFCYMSPSEPSDICILSTNIKSQLLFYKCTQSLY